MLMKRMRPSVPQKSSHISGLSLWHSLVLLHAHVLFALVALLPGPGVHTYRCTPTGLHNLGDDAIPQVPIIQANGGKSLTHSLCTGCPKNSA